MLSSAEELFAIQPTVGLVLRLSHTMDLPRTWHLGAMDAHCYALLEGISEDNRAIAAPVVLIEKYKGQLQRWALGAREFAVGRSLLAQRRDKLLRRVIGYVSQGVTEIWLQPHYAMYRRRAAHDQAAGPANQGAPTNGFEGAG